MESPFFDILGALIGFITVMLLLSMIITALVQATQSLLRLRGRNLLFGLATIIGESSDDMSWKSAKDKARMILNDSNAPVLLGRAGRDEKLGKLIGPQVSWLDPDQLKTILDNCPANLDTEVKIKIHKRFAILDNVLRKRFLRNMRLWTILWALPVAFYFQVSAPAVFRDFLNDPELRAQALRMAPELQARTQATLDSQVSYEQVSVKALDKLAEQHPELRETLEEASGIGKNKVSIVDELAMVLDDNPQKAAILAEYEAILDANYTEQLDAALEAIGVNVTDLRRFNIDPWSKRWTFYVNNGVPQWPNIVGVIMTMIFLSFGAPFWFNALKSFVNLRDALKPPSDTEKPENKLPSGRDQVAVKNSSQSNVSPPPDQDQSA
ncbi:MAG: hypothetical protein PVI97_15840 [Candidatus Thiodiazotropha sp.]|jgi:hypothetical protein